MRPARNPREGVLQYNKKEDASNEYQNIYFHDRRRKIMHYLDVKILFPPNLGVITLLDNAAHQKK